MKGRDLEGRRCLVTGGSRGLGFAIAMALASRGARIAFTYSKNDDDAAEARERIAGATAEPLVFKGSVADAAHVKATLAALGAAWDGIDVLVNAAGIQQVLPIALLEEADWDTLMAINVKGAYLWSRAVLKRMIRARRGHILNVGSFASERFVESPVHYAAAKSALRGFTEALALEVGRYGITVNLLSPGLCDVGLTTMLPRHRIAEYESRAALGRLGNAEEIGEVAAFLVSDAASFTTGAKVVVDGGL